MMRYFELADEVMLAGRWHLGDVLSAAGDEPALADGIPCVPHDQLVAEVFRQGRVLDFSYTSLGVPVTTPALADAVTAVARSDVQSLPLSVPGQQEMRVLNVVRVIRCLDEKHSEFIKWTRQDHRHDLAGQYRQVTRLALTSWALPSDAHCFRVDGWEVVVVVSEAVKDAMEATGCFGARFSELEQFSDGALGTW